MDKAKSYVGWFLLGTASVLAGLKIYEALNKPKVAAPATTPAATTPAS